MSRDDFSRWTAIFQVRVMWRIWRRPWAPVAEFCRTEEKP